MLYSLLMSVCKWLTDSCMLTGNYMADYAKRRLLSTTITTYHLFSGDNGFSISNNWILIEGDDISYKVSIGLSTPSRVFWRYLYRHTWRSRDFNLNHIRQHLHVAKERYAQESKQMVQ